MEKANVQVIEELEAWDDVSGAELNPKGVKNTRSEGEEGLD